MNHQTRCFIDDQQVGIFVHDRQFHCFRVQFHRSDFRINRQDFTAIELSTRFYVITVQGQLSGFDPALKDSSGVLGEQVCRYRIKPLQDMFGSGCSNQRHTLWHQCCSRLLGLTRGYG